MYQRTTVLALALLFVTIVLIDRSSRKFDRCRQWLIYDNVSNVTWMSNGLTFTNDIAGNTANPSGNPYTGPLLGTIVTPRWVPPTPLPPMT
ncbi:MAG: hypothetical protein U0361_23520 [Nitrospiraceae bacterium]